MKSIQNFFNRNKDLLLSNEKMQISISLIILGLIFLYQLIKSRLNFQYQNSPGNVINISLPALILFIAVSIVLVVLTPKLVKLENKKIIALAIFCSSFLVSASYTLMRGIDWTLSDESQDSFELAMEVQRQGVPEFIATYNDRGNPGVLGTSQYANNVYGVLRSLGLEQMAKSYWVGRMETQLARPYMHPPTFFIVLAGWLHIFGNTQLSATIFMWICTAIWGLTCFLLLDALQSKASVFLTLLFITLPTTIIDTWLTTYDGLSGMFLMAGFGLFILATFKKNNRFYFISGIAFGVSIMFRLTSLFFVLLFPIVLLILVSTRRQFVSSILLFLLGLFIFPFLLLIAGYNPILTLVTAKFRQDAYYAGKSMISALERLPVFFYLGISLIILIAFGILRRSKELIKSTKGIWILLPLIAMILIAIITRLTSDFHRNMLGVSGCFIFSLSCLENWPQSRKYQALYIGIDLAFVLLITLL